MNQLKQKGENVMNFMEAKKENYKSVNEIINVLNKNGHTILEAQAILSFTANRIASTSKVGQPIDFNKMS